MYENIVIGRPDMDLHLLFAYDEEDWIAIESEKTLYTNERYLPNLLVYNKIASSNSEVRRNKPELVTKLTERAFIKIKWGKKFVFIAVFPE